MVLNVSIKKPIPNLLRGGEHVLVILQNSKGEILLAGKPKYPPGMLRLPGGGLTTGEDVALGAKREILEELGIEVAGVTILEKIEIVAATSDRKYFLTEYIAYANIGDLQVKIADKELNNLQWLKPESLLEVAKTYATFKDGGIWEDSSAVYGPVHKIAYEAFMAMK